MDDDGVVHYCDLEAFCMNKFTLEKVKRLAMGLGDECINFIFDKYFKI